MLIAIPFVIPKVKKKTHNYLSIQDNGKANCSIQWNTTQQFKTNELLIQCNNMDKSQKHCIAMSIIIIITIDK